MKDQTRNCGVQFVQRHRKGPRRRAQPGCSLDLQTPPSGAEGRNAARRRSSCVNSETLSGRAASSSFPFLGLPSALRGCRITDKNDTCESVAPVSVTVPAGTMGVRAWWPVCVASSSLLTAQGLAVTTSTSVPQGDFRRRPFLLHFVCRHANRIPASRSVRLLLPPSLCTSVPFFLPRHGVSRVSGPHVTLRLVRRLRGAEPGHTHLPGRTSLRREGPRPP